MSQVTITVSEMEVPCIIHGTLSEYRITRISKDKAPDFIKAHFIDPSDGKEDYILLHQRDSIIVTGNPA